MTPPYALVAARSRNHVIGRDADIPWTVKGEQALFKKITMNGCLIMGRRTFESIGRPLPGRLTQIVTRQTQYAQPGCRVFHSIEAALQDAQQTGRPIFVIGGGELYAATLANARQVHLTTIDLEVAGNVFFPDFPTPAFKLTHREHFESNHHYTYEIYEQSALETV